MDDVAARPARAAEAIWNAWSGGTTVPELSVEARPRTVAEGWAAQQSLAALAGPSLGWKLAATSEAGRRHINVEAPLIGRLFTRFVHEPGVVLAADHLTLRVVEAEFAFRMGRGLAGPGPHDEAGVLAAVAALHLALEVPDTRLERFATVGAAQLLADDACAGSFVLGPAVEGWQELDLARQETHIRVNGEHAASGVGANVLAGPVDALVWCANELARLGPGLSAGDVVTTGTTTVPPPIGPGDRVEGDFGGLGTVALSFRP